MRVLLVEPNDLLARAVVRVAASLGWAVEVRTSHQTSLAGCTRGAPFDAILTHWGRDAGDRSAMELVGEARSRGIPVAVISGHVRLVEGVEWIEKPAGTDVLRRWLHSVRPAAAEELRP